MDAWIARRERESGRTNPMFTNLQWHGTDHAGPFTSSQQAYDTLHIGSAKAAKSLQAKSRSKKSTASKKRRPKKK
jgi:hypothetical protein